MKSIIPVCIVLFLVSFLVAYKLASSNRDGRQSMETVNTNAPILEPPPAARENKAADQSLPILAFKWKSIESDNSSELIANLRGIECPEATIIDIVEGRLNEAYRPRFRAALASANRLPLPLQMHQRIAGTEAVKQEIDSMLYVKLGLHRQPRSAGVLFTADEEQKIADARQQFTPIQIFDTKDTNLVARSTASRQARIEFLSSHFSSEKLLLYKLDRESSGQSVNVLFQGYRPSESQFMTVAKALDAANLNIKVDGLTPEAEICGAKKFLASQFLVECTTSSRKL
jgi:hypothetical protein